MDTRVHTHTHTHTQMYAPHTYLHYVQLSNILYHIVYIPVSYSHTVPIVTGYPCEQVGVPVSLVSPNRKHSSDDLNSHPGCVGIFLTYIYKIYGLSISSKYLDACPFVYVVIFISKYTWSGGIRSLLYINNEYLGHMVSDISYISGLIWKCGYCAVCAIVVVIVTIFYCGQVIISCE